MIVVTGMHRSGTSLVSLLLQRMGGDFGAEERLLAKDRWNADGYLECLDAIELNNWMLLGLDSDIRYWAQPATSPVKRLLTSLISKKWKYFLFPSQGKIATRAAILAEKMKQFSKEYQGCFVKDPRFSLTLNSWMQQGEVSAAIFCYRNPRSVQKSVGRRDVVPGWLANRFWLYHQVGFVRALEGDVPVLLIDYDQFFTEECDAQLSAIADFMKKIGSLNSTNHEIADVIDRSKRHHAGEDKLEGSVAAAYRGLSLARKKYPSGASAIEIRNQLSQTGFPF